MTTNLPLIIEPEQVNKLTNNDNIRIIDVSQGSSYIKHHVPNAVFLDYSWIVDSDKPRMGLLPSQQQLIHILSAYGIDETTHVIAYDDEGGGRASRLLWTLRCVGHQHYSLMNGGLHAWLGENHPIDNDIHFPTPTTRQTQIQPAPIADKDFILDNLENNEVVILDTRSPQEFNGIKVFAARGGHIPGAVNYEWTKAMDQNAFLKLRDNTAIMEELAGLGVTPDKTIVCHCQSHHRSAYTCIMLEALGFDQVKGYPGSWSEWGNDPTTPIA